MYIYIYTLYVYIYTLYVYIIIYLSISGKWLVGATCCCPLLPEVSVILHGNPCLALTHILWASIAALDTVFFPLFCRPISLKAKSDLATVNFDSQNISDESTCNSSEFCLQGNWVQPSAWQEPQQHMYGSCILYTYVQTCTDDFVRSCLF